MSVSFVARTRLVLTTLGASVVAREARTEENRRLYFSSCYHTFKKTNDVTYFHSIIKYMIQKREHLDIVNGPGRYGHKKKKPTEENVCAHHLKTPC